MSGIFNIIVTGVLTGLFLSAVADQTSAGLCQNIPSACPDSPTLRQLCHEGCRACKSCGAYNDIYEASIKAYDCGYGQKCCQLECKSNTNLGVTRNEKSNHVFVVYTEPPNAFVVPSPLPPDTWYESDSVVASNYRYVSMTFGYIPQKANLNDQFMVHDAPQWTWYTFYPSGYATNPVYVLPLKKINYGLTLYVDTHQVPYVESQNKGVRFVFRPQDGTKPIWNRRLQEANESKTEDEVDLSRRQLSSNPAPAVSFIFSGSQTPPRTP